MIRRVAAALSFGFALAAAQAAPAAPPAFDVVSVRPFRKIGPWHHQARYDPQRLTIEGKYTEELIEEAYGVNPNQIVGMPRAMERELFAVSGTTDRTATPEKMRLMLRRALADRFQLVVEDADEIQPVYELVVAPGGPKLRAARPGKDCDDQFIAFDQLKALGIPANASVLSNYCSIARLVEALNGPMGHAQLRLPVIDRTGLAGTYVLALWLEYEREERLPSGGTRLINLESLPQALKSELGLALVKTRGPYRTLTIKHIVEPTPN